MLSCIFLSLLATLPAAGGNNTSADDHGKNIVLVYEDGSLVGALPTPLVGHLAWLATPDRSATVCVKTRPTSVDVWFVGGKPSMRACRRAKAVEGAPGMASSLHDPVEDQDSVISCSMAIGARYATVLAEPQTALATCLAASAMSEVYGMKTPGITPTRDSSQHESLDGRTAGEP